MDQSRLARQPESGEGSTPSAQSAVPAPAGAFHTPITGVPHGSSGSHGQAQQPMAMQSMQQHHQPGPTIEQLAAFLTEMAHAGNAQTPVLPIYR